MYWKRTIKPYLIWLVIALLDIRCEKIIKENIDKNIRISKKQKASETIYEMK